MKRRYQIDQTPPVPLEVLQSPEIGAAGALLVNGIVAWESVYEYGVYDEAGNLVGVRRELVTREALFGDSARTLARCPVTLQHPDELVTPDNVADLGVGDADSVIEEHVIEKRGGYASVKLAVRRADAIEALLDPNGPKQLSPGYFVEYDETPGIWVAPDGTEVAYDARQVKREYNHIAIVDAARGGPTCSIKMDGAMVRTSIGRAVTSPPNPVRGTPVIDSLLTLVVRADGLLKSMRQSTARDAATQAWWSAQDAVFSEIYRISEISNPDERKAAIDAFNAEFPDVVGEISAKLSALLDAMAKQPEEQETEHEDASTSFPTAEQIAEAVVAKLAKPQADAAPKIDSDTLDAYYKRRAAVEAAAASLDVAVDTDMTRTARTILDKLGVECESDQEAVTAALAAAKAAGQTARGARIKHSDQDEDPTDIHPDYTHWRQK